MPGSRSRRTGIEAFVRQSRHRFRHRSIWRLTRGPPARIARCRNRWSSPHEARFARSAWRTRLHEMVTGKPQAVMLHTNVGTANSINMLIDASRDRIPMLLKASGRKRRLLRSGAEGSRSACIFIGRRRWKYDQAGMLREMVKWDYEMKRRRIRKSATVVDRAMEMNVLSSPQGQAGLSQSAAREVLAETVGPAEKQSRASRETAGTGGGGARHRTARGLDRRREESVDHHGHVGA